MANDTFSVKPILRTDKKKMDGTCPINYLVRINSKPTKLRSGDFCEPANWNSTKSCFKGSSSSYENGALDNDVASIKNFLRLQKSLNKPLSTQMVQEWWSTNDADDFYEFFDKVCEKKFKTLAVGTQGHYKLLRRRLMDFKKKVKISDIDVKFIENFHIYLSDELQIGKSGVWSRHKNLKSILGYAVKSGIIKSNPYTEFDERSPADPPKESLTRIELKLIEKISFSRFKFSKGLELSRDKFLFTCYTGLRFGDLDALTVDKLIDSETLSLKMQKTKFPLVVPLSPKAKKLLQKYSKTEGSFFPKRTNVSLNRDLKRIASMCKIKKNLTHHVARHTFATMLIRQNVNPFIVMKLLGHRSIKTTQIYVNSNSADLAEAVNSISDFR